MALPLHRSVVARNSGSFSFKERWVTRLAGPVSMRLMKPTDRTELHKDALSIARLS